MQPTLNVQHFIALLAEARGPSRQLDALIGVAARTLEPTTMIGFAPGVCYRETRKGKPGPTLVLSASWEQTHLGWAPRCVRPYSGGGEAARDLIPDGWWLQLIQIGRDRWAAVLRPAGQQGNGVAPQATFATPGLAISAAAIMLLSLGRAALKSANGEAPT